MLCSRPQVQSHSRGTKAVIAGLLAGIVLLLLPPLASANFVYWASAGQTTIGRAKLNGTGVNNAFITGLTGVQGVAVDSQHIYWTQGLGATSTIGRANLDGSGVNPNFIPHSAGVQDFDPVVIGSAAGIAVNSNAIFWENSGSATVGKANLDGSSAAGNLVTSGPEPACGLAADQNFVYWLDTGLAQSVGRATVNGTDRQGSFIGGAANAGSCGLAVDPSFLYWGANPQSIGRAPVGGGTANNAFVPSAVAAANSVCGVAVNSQYIFWGNSGASDFIGRSNLSGSGSNPSLIGGPTDPCLPAAAPANKITVTSITKKKKKGTATIGAKVSGPGQVTLNQTSTPPDTNAVASSVKQIGLTLTQASSFKLAVKPKGKTAKKLKKQIKKKGRGSVKVKVFIHFAPAGVAGVPNTKQVTLTLIKQGKKK
jgi:hypothetical protein